MTCQVYAGQLGYGPNPKLQQRIRDADLMLVVGAAARRGNDRRLHAGHARPSRPDCWSTSIPIPTSSAGSIRPTCRSAPTWANSPRCSTSGSTPTWSASPPARTRTRNGSNGPSPQPREGVKLDLGPCVKAMRDALPEQHDHLQRRGQFLGLVAPLLALWPDADPARADQSGTMGYGLPAAVAAALRFKDRPVVCVAGDGDFLMNGQELATAAQYGADLLVILVDNWSLRHDPHAPGARLSEARVGDGSRQPRLRRARARRMAAGPRRSRRPKSSRPRSTRRMKRKGIRLLHCVTDVEQISNATTIAASFARSEASALRTTLRRRSTARTVRRRDPAAQASRPHAWSP